MKLNLNNERAGILILRIDYNNIGNKKLTEKKLAKRIVKIGQQCKKSNVNDVFI